MLFARQSLFATLVLALCVGALAKTFDEDARFDKRDLSSSLRGIKRKFGGGGSTSGGDSSRGSSLFGSSHGGSTTSSSSGSSHGSSTPGRGGSASPKSPREQLGKGKPQFYEKQNFPHEEQQMWRHGTIAGTALKSVDKQNKAKVNAAYLNTKLEKKGTPVGSDAYNRMKHVPLTKANQHAKEIKIVDKTQAKVDLAHKWAKDEVASGGMHKADLPILKDTIRSHQKYGEKRVADGDKGSKRARLRL